jgi:acetyl esterase/lipase
MAPNMLLCMNVSYGPRQVGAGAAHADVAQLYDLVLPAEIGKIPKDAPVFVYIHGGAWAEGSKSWGLPMLADMAGKGFVGITMNYTMNNPKFGEHTFAEMLADIDALVSHLPKLGKAIGVDIKRFAIGGSSAGGHLSAWMAMNTDGFDGEEWAGESSEVQAAVDFFGPVDVKTCNLIEIENFKNPNHRWHKIEETHGGALLGGDPATMVERSDSASPIFHISEKTAPIIILHGDQDPLVPVSMSEDFYDRLEKAGLADQSELYIVKNGGHGTRELFQTECKQLILDFLDRYLKK